MSKLKVSQGTKDKLWWMIIAIDYDYSRISIADHQIDDSTLTLWLEDKQDFKNSLEECLQVKFTHRQFAAVIRQEKLNSYEGTKTHPIKGFVYKTTIEINEPIRWYREDATLVEQQWAREAMVKKLIEYLIGDELFEQIAW